MSDDENKPVRRCAKCKRVLYDGYPLVYDYRIYCRASGDEGCLRAQLSLQHQEAEELKKGTTVDIVFDGPPGPESGRFVEVESPPGVGIKFGQWVRRDDGYWVLRFPYQVPFSLDEMKGTMNRMVDLLGYANTRLECVEHSLQKVHQDKLDAEAIMREAMVDGGYAYSGMRELEALMKVIALGVVPWRVKSKPETWTLSACLISDIRIQDVAVHGAGKYATALEALVAAKKALVDAKLITNDGDLIQGEKP